MKLCPSCQCCSVRQGANRKREKKDCTRYNNFITKPPQSEHKQSAPTTAAAAAAAKNGLELKSTPRTETVQDILQTHRVAAVLCCILTSPSCTHPVVLRREKAAPFGPFPVCPVLMRCKCGQAVRRKRQYLNRMQQPGASCFRCLCFQGVPSVRSQLLIFLSEPRARPVRHHQGTSYVLFSTPKIAPKPANDGTRSVRICVCNAGLCMVHMLRFCVFQCRCQRLAEHNSRRRKSKRELPGAAWELRSWVKFPESGSVPAEVELNQSLYHLWWKLIFRSGFPSV